MAKEPTKADPVADMPADPVRSGIIMPITSTPGYEAGTGRRWDLSARLAGRKRKNLSAIVTRQAGCRSVPHA